jgi:hypothetical protein
MHHDRLVGGQVQGEHPGAVLGGGLVEALGAGALRAQLQGRRGEPRHALLLLHHLLVGLGGVHHVVRELGAQLGQLLLVLVEPLLGIALLPAPPDTALLKSDPLLKSVQLPRSSSAAVDSQPHNIAGGTPLPPSTPPPALLSVCPLLLPVLTSRSCCAIWPPVSPLALPSAQRKSCEA